MLERDVQKKSVDYAKRRGWWARKFVAAGRRSAPDYVFAKQNSFGLSVLFFCEFKRTAEDATDLQKEEHRVMREAGLIVHVCDDPDAFKLILESHEP